MKRRELKEYPFVTFWKESNDDDVIYFSYSVNLNITIDIAKEIVNSRLEYIQQKPAYFLIDATNIVSVTKEAREYMSNPEGGLKGILAGAFISNKVLTTVLINLFFKINKPKVPARFFTKKEDAIAWLLKVKYANENNP